MHRIDSTGTAVALPTPDAVGVTVGYFTGGNPGTGTPATRMDPDWCNAVQEEIAGVIVGAGISLDKTSQAQLLTAIMKLIAGGSGGVTTVVFSASPYDLITTKKIVVVDTTSGNVQINIPVGTTVPGEEWHIIKLVAANSVNFNGTVNGESNPSFTEQYTSLKLRSLGANGWIWS